MQALGSSDKLFSQIFFPLISEDSSVGSEACVGQSERDWVRLSLD